MGERTVRKGGNRKDVISIERVMRRANLNWCMASKLSSMKFSPFL